MLEEMVKAYQTSWKKQISEKSSEPMTVEIEVYSPVNDSISLVITGDQYGQCIWREYR